MYVLRGMVHSPWVHVISLEVVKKSSPCLGSSKSYTGAGSVYVSRGQFT